jgi:class 3 adenylate cyclase
MICDGHRAGPAESLRIILVVDLVESVRLMQEDGWRVSAANVREPRPGSRTLSAGVWSKNLGDGLMAEFKTVRKRSALRPRCTADGRSARAAVGAARPAGRTPQNLRRGDGHRHRRQPGSRVCTLAEAGETVATAQLRDLLSDTLDADIEDLGDAT